MDVYGCGLPCSREPDRSKIVAVSYSLFSFSFYSRATAALLRRLSFDNTCFNLRYNVSLYHRSKSFSFIIYLFFFFLEIFRFFLEIFDSIFIPPPLNKKEDRLSIPLLLEREGETCLFSQSKYK